MYMFIIVYPYACKTIYIYKYVHIYIYTHATTTNIKHTSINIIKSYISKDFANQPHKSTCEKVTLAARQVPARDCEFQQ